MFGAADRGRDCRHRRNNGRGGSKTGVTRGTETGETGFSKAGGTVEEGMEVEGMEAEACGSNIGIMKGVRGVPEVTYGREEEEEGDELG